MEFVLNGRPYSLDPATIRYRVSRVEPDPIRTHWVDIDGRRFPPKQAFRAATGLYDEPFVTHFAIRIFQRLGFSTSPIPGAQKVAPRVSGLPDVVATEGLSDESAVEAFRRLDGFMSANALTSTLTGLEASLVGAGRDESSRVAIESGFDEDLVDAALVVRERVGMLDTLIHAAVITQTLPLVLEKGEQVFKRPSLGAGNDPDRVFDLETNLRVAEFKLSSWKGSDGMRQRGLFADVVGLSLDDSGRRRQVFVVGQLPVRFLTQSKRNAAKTLSKASLRLRTPAGMADEMTVAEFTRQAGVEVIDLTTLLPGLR
ncbi:hypothetical protein [Myceligenerans xiligouense]|uniref:Uncharacterized protein n=1 Tax=Myceligenerans xiligouense TaxID=253184 RepID=A0A3N4YIN0_9MICO|nr:hypothetical protein [Myceligenerans xiligouense]RPF20989.1 hypothetical protein EDD34_1597 [Myceligenerans xiligouense]